MDVVSDLFDGQAASFDQRAGLPAEYCHDIADAVVEIGQAGAGDLLVEVGSGTGQIGRWFGPGIRYLGLDKSARMLDEFQRRLSGANRDNGGNNDFGDRALIRADADAGWPVAEGAARVIFSSRAMHLLNRRHAVSEVFRVASREGATLILGRVEREPNSVKKQLAKEMNDRIRRQGFEAHRSDKGSQRLVESCCRRGAEAMQPVRVATWRVIATAGQLVDSWRKVVGLGGVPIPAHTKEEILKELELWAKGVFGRLDRQFESTEAYVLTPVRMPGRSNS